MHRPTPRQLFFAAILCTSLPLTTGWLGVAPAAAETSPAQEMAHAIARMMESMGLTGSAGYGSSGYAPPGADGWPSAFGAWPGAGGNPAREMSRMGEELYRRTPMAGGTGATPRGATVLEGVWEDSQGGVLIVQGNRYRLYSQCRGFIEGRIRAGDDRVELSNDRDGITQVFELALDQGRLALRNASGDLFLYRRLVLNQDR